VPDPAPTRVIPLYVVAPASRLPRVRRELMRPAFRALALDRRCRFFSSEALLKALPSLARWATGPDAIEKLAEMVTAIELMTAAQGLEYHAPLAPGRGVKQAYEIVRGLVAPLEQDRTMSGDIEKLTAAIRGGDFDLFATDNTDE